MEIQIIIQMIMAILTVVMEFLGGGTFPKMLDPNTKAAFTLAAQEWHCDAPYWSTGTGVQGAEFKGDVTVECFVHGSGKGSISVLHAHLVREAEQRSADTSPEVLFQSGMPTLLYRGDLVSDSDEGPIPMTGETLLSSDGFTTLRAEFRSELFPKSGSIRYLHSMAEKVEVTLSDTPEWYRVRLVSESRIKKPSLVGSSLFEKIVTEKQEERLDQRLEQLMNDLAAHL